MNVARQKRNLFPVSLSRAPSLMAAAAHGMRVLSMLQIPFAQAQATFPGFDQSGHVPHPGWFARKAPLNGSANPFAPSQRHNIP